MSYVKAGVLGGIILFLWSMISWMLLPWHNLTLNQFKDEKIMVQTIRANVPKSGMYLMPGNMEIQNETPKPPMVFASVRAEGMTDSMTIPMVISLITQIVAATLVAWLLSRTRGLTYLQRVFFTVVVALVAGIIVEVPYWNWFGFDPNFVLVAFADLLIGWFLAGLVIARFYRVE